MRPAPTRALAVITLAAALIAAGAVAAPAQTPLPSPGVTVRFEFLRAPTFTTFRSLQLRDVPAGSTIVVRCLTKSGDRCSGRLHRAFKATGAEGTVEVTRFEHKRIRAGRRLEAKIANPAFATEFKTIHVRRRANPTITTQCRQPGETQRTAC